MVSTKASKAKESKVFQCVNLDVAFLQPEGELANVPRKGLALAW
jgi:hypothetical protein